jgi:large subunit ribosomal protein L18e
MKQDSVRARLAHSFAKHSKSKNEKVWRDLARSLQKSRNNRSVVNVGEISRHSRDGSVVLIAGKVLGAGTIDHKVTVAAYSFSQAAMKKVLSSGGKCLNLGQLAESSIDAKGVIVLA